MSPYLFILGTEIGDKEIQEIRIFNSEAKISQFADDTSLVCKSCHSVEKAIEALDSFGNFSGLRLNTTKTKALWLGLWRHRVETPFGFKCPKEPGRKEFFEFTTSLWRVVPFCRMVNLPRSIIKIVTPSSIYKWSL